MALVGTDVIEIILDVEKALSPAHNFGRKLSELDKMLDGITRGSRLASREIARLIPGFDRAGKSALGLARSSDRASTSIAKLIPGLEGADRVAQGLGAHFSQGAGGINNFSASARRAKGPLEHLFLTAKKLTHFDLTPSGIAAGAIRGLAGGAVDATRWFGGTVVDAARDRGLQMTAFTTLLGNRDKADKMLNKLLDVASLTPANNAEVTDWGRRLLVAGYSNEKDNNGFERVLGGTLDLQAAFGNKTANNFLSWMTQLKSRGEPRNAAINALSRYISNEEVVKSLGLQYKEIGYNPKRKWDEKERQRVQGRLVGLVKDHKIGYLAFQEAIFASIAKQFRETELGNYAKRKGTESLAGVLGNLEQAVPTFLTRLNIDHFNGIKEVKRFLVDFMDFLNLATPQGRKLAKTIEDVINELFGGLKYVTKDDIGKFFERGTEAAKSLLSVIRDTWGMVDGLLHGDASKFFESFGRVFFDIGILLGKGIWSGFMAAAGFGKTNTPLFEKEDIATKRQKLLDSGVKPGTYAYEVAMSTNNDAMIRRLKLQTTNEPLKLLEPPAASVSDAQPIAANRPTGVTRSASSNVTIGDINIQMGNVMDMHEFEQKLGDSLERVGHRIGAARLQKKG